MNRQEINSNPALMMQVFTDFVSQFESKINALRLALIIIKVTGRQQGVMDVEKIISFVETIIHRINGWGKFKDDAEQLERHRSTMKRDQKEAELLLELEKAYWIMQRSGETSANEVRKALRKTKERIDALGFVENAVQAHYYKVVAGLFKQMNLFNEFYQNALLFLAYTPIEDIPTSLQQAYAFDIGIAALIGDRIYNFSELLGHPVVESLRDSPAEWLFRLLFAFNKGNIAEYQQHAQQFSREPILQQKQAFLHEKMQLMCLMEIVFEKGATERVISFDEIARRTGLQANQVEYLLLKGLSLNLIRGTIDQVDQSVHVVWVQPRVLDSSQVSNMRNKLGEWLGKVNQTIDYLRTKGSETVGAEA